MDCQPVSIKWTAMVATSIDQLLGDTPHPIFFIGPTNMKMIAFQWQVSLKVHFWFSALKLLSTAGTCFGLLLLSDDSHIYLLAASQRPNLTWCLTWLAMSSDSVILFNHLHILTETPHAFSLSVETCSRKVRVNARALIQT